VILRSPFSRSELLTLLFYFLSPFFFSLFLFSLFVPFSLFFSHAVRFSTRKVTISLFS